MSSKRMIQFMIIALLSLAGVLGVDLFSKATAQASEVPAQIRPCIPTDQVARVEMIGSAEVGDRFFYLLAAYERNDPQFADLVISLVGQQCTEEWYNPMGDRVSLTSEIGKEAGRLLTLERYRKLIGDVGREQFQRFVDSSVAEGASEWFEEEIWALDQLRIAIPENTSPIQE